MKVLPLDAGRHDRKGFDCGNEALNNYLRQMVAQQSRRNVSRTYVLVAHEEAEEIWGFYTLGMIQLDLSALPQGLRQRLRPAQSAGLIARLAVDRGYQGRGFGAFLLVDGLRRLLNAAETVGFLLVFVDAKEGVAAFYEAFGFVPLASRPDRLFMKVA